MNRLPAALLLFLLAAFSAISAAKQTISLTENGSGKILVISAGQRFTLTLPNRADGGYRFDKVQYDPAFLRLDEHIKKQPPAGSPLGKAGEDSWEFAALKKGKTTIKITASRPWTKAGIMTEFRNDVNIK